MRYYIDKSSGFSYKNVTYVTIDDFHNQKVDKGTNILYYTNTT